MYSTKAIYESKVVSEIDTYVYIDVYEHVWIKIYTLVKGTAPRQLTDNAWENVQVKSRSSYHDVLANKLRSYVLGK